MLRNSIFYLLKPCIPRRTQLYFRKKMIERKMQCQDIAWPIDPDAGKALEKIREWPDGKKFAVVLTHDVEKERGQERVCQVMQMEMELGFRSAFNFVPERYDVSPVLRNHLTRNGFEVGVHDLNHDGRLFGSKLTFDERAPRINKYLKQWRASGFRAGAMHHNLDWIGRLNVEYDCSTFDTDPFEPQPDGVGTIFPFHVKRSSGTGSYIELPYTLPQDFTLFVLLREKTNRIWREKVDWIAGNGGMVLVNTHPDYMAFGRREPGLEEYTVDLYMDFLKYVCNRYGGEYWQAIPREIARHWNNTEHEAIPSGQTGELWGNE